MLVHCYNCERVEKTINGACSHCGLLSGVVAAVSCADTMGCLKCIGALKDARLIDAAPELLEAARFAEQLLTALVRTDRDDEERDAAGEVLLQIRGAIAKAEGK